MEPEKRLILASSSPRRQAFLSALGVAFSVCTADIDETPYPGEGPEALAKRLAAGKAHAVLAQVAKQEAGGPWLVLAADTVVAHDAEILGKPADAADARRMLRALRDGAHQVYSAVCVYDAAAHENHSRINTTSVWMRAYTDAEMEAYIASRDPMDKAGAYAIQHPTFAPAVELEGCLSGVVGLPLGDVRDLLAEVGFTLPPVAPVCEARTQFACCRSAQGAVRQAIRS